MTDASPTSDLLARTTFTAVDSERDERVRAEALRHLPREGPARVLEIGCGNGALLHELAEARSSLEAVGVDVSEPSIELARRTAESRGLEARTRFLAGDYLTTEIDGQFDVVVADGVLHLIPGPTDGLLVRLAAHLRPGGALVVEMPYRTPYNAGLVALRRVLRRLRGPRIEALALRIARRLHGAEMPEEALRERLIYIYVVPERLGGRRFDAAAQTHGLELVGHWPMPQLSPGELRHRLSVYRRA